MQQTYYNNFTTPIGKILLGTNDFGLQFAVFTGSSKLERLLSSFDLISKNHTYLDIAKQQLDEYFLGKRQSFDIPLNMVGTDFQKSVWQTLLKIPYRQTLSYKQEAITLGKESAVRAVANANGANKIGIIIPCHRVIASDGTLGGYGGGIDRKEFLLNLEYKNNRKTNTFEIA
jgi:O-6-methylguanine DNA methyltransferase